MDHPIHEKLVSALALSRLVAIHDLFWAWADQSGLPDASSILELFTNDVSTSMYDLCYTSALEPLSTISLDQIPPFLPYLAAPESPEFPRQAQGLHILLDQVPRAILSGVDERWTVDFFADLTVRFARELCSLGPNLQPQRVGRWLELGFSFEASWLRAFLLNTAFIHSEDLADQLHGQQAIEDECRAVAEAHYGVADPTRELEEQDRNNVALFSELARSVNDGVGSSRREDALWFICRIIRAHESIIRVYGRYPYRNGSLGRSDTNEEAAFLVQTDNFGTIDPKVAKLIRENIETGKMRPLQGQRPEE